MGPGEEGVSGGEERGPERGAIGRILYYGTGWELVVVTIASFEGIRDFTGQ